MKKPVWWLIWLSGLLGMYVGSSGPAILLYHTRLSQFIDVVYTPLTYFATYTHAYRVLLPYWRLWMGWAGTDACPFMLG
jgi:hypothetical protein